MKSLLVTATRACALLLLAVSTSLLPAASTLAASNKDDRDYRLRYTLEPQPESGYVKVSIAIDDAKLIKSVAMDFDKKRFSKFEADGKLKVDDGSLLWRPGKGKETLSYRVRVDNKRDGDSYDALMTDDWAIFRIDHVIPSAHTRSVKGSHAVTSLKVKLPKNWEGVDTGWPRNGKQRFAVDEPHRNFDRPTGWLIAGKIGVRRDFLEGTQVSVAAPVDNAMQRMDALALINLVWPEVQRAFFVLPKKILMVGASDPMWRGGLSAPNSFYLHSSRPIVSENGTSTVLHELTHVITRLRARRGADWLVEGIAEFYSIELMLRSGAMNERRHERTLERLEKWGEDVTTLKAKESTGPRTARAVLLLYDLDREIRDKSRGLHSIDDVTRALMERRSVSGRSLELAVERLLGEPSKVLDTSLLR